MKCDDMEGELETQKWKEKKEKYFRNEDQN